MTIARNLRERLPKIPLRFLTLTMKATSDPLVDQLEKLTKCFAKLRARKEIKDRVSGGIYFIEVTRNADTNLWHPHIHAIVQGSYIPVEVIKKLWLAITTDSYIVHITLLRDAREAAYYVCKYSAKSLSVTVWSDQEAYAEAVSALHGKRLLQPFGTWTDLKLTSTPETDEGWIVVGPLWQVLEKARAGDPESLSIIANLKGESYEPLDLNATDVSPPALPDVQ